MKADPSPDQRKPNPTSQVAMKALKNVHPVTHAVGNTMRRVVIMLICILVFQTPVSLTGAVGSTIAIGGSYAPRAQARPVYR